MFVQVLPFLVLGVVVSGLIATFVSAAGVRVRLGSHRAPAVRARHERRVLVATTDQFAVTVAEANAGAHFHGLMGLFSPGYGSTATVDRPATAEQSLRDSTLIWMGWWPSGSGRGDGFALP